MIKVTDFPTPQAAIDTAKLLGGGRGCPVLFPNGTYALTAPLIVPRTGASPLNVVHIEGEGRYTTILTAGAGFPANRALIEWQATPERAWEQRISNIGFVLPNVAGVKAIHYKVTNNTSWTAVNTERLQLDLEDIYIAANNDYHEVLIRLEGIVNDSSLRRIFGDPALGNGTYDTLLLQVDKDFNGTLPGNADAPGLWMCDVSQLRGMIRRGGQCAVFEGRMHRSTMSTCFGNGGKNRPNFAFYNSYNSDLVNLATEGQGEKPQYLFNNCHKIRARVIGIGTPNAIGASGIGNGLELVNSHGCKFEGRDASAGQPAFSGLGVKVVTVDAASRRNTFVDWDVRSGGTPADEFTVQGGCTNTVSYYDYQTDTSGVITGT